MEYADKKRSEGRSAEFTGVQLRWAVDMPSRPGAVFLEAIMSEYQYYEWQTIERTLTPDEQAAVEDLSSHIEVTPPGRRWSLRSRK